MLLITLSLSLMAQAQPNPDRNASSCPGMDVSLDQFRWENRILIIFAEDSNSDSYRTQIEKFSSFKEGVLDRDLIIFSIFKNECSTLDDQNISDSSAEKIRSELSPQSSSFSIYLVGKDGGVKLKKDEVLGIDELFRVIDRMPMRQREMRDGG